MNWSFGSLNERERRMLIYGGVVAAVLVVVGIILPLNRSVAKTHDRVGRKQVDLAWMRSVAPAVTAAGPVGATPTTQESLLVVVDRAARESGLSGSLVSSEPSGAGGLRVRLEKAPFDVLVGWLARLADQNGVRVESASVDGAGEAGLVNAAIVLQTR